MGSACDHDHDHSGLNGGALDRALAAGIHWEAMAERLKSLGTTFVIEPYIRFKGQPGEQATMFFLDPSGNAIEVKAFGDIGKAAAAASTRLTN